MSKGRLLYVVGASGSGKDSIINGVRMGQGELFNIIFAHRYITRSVLAGGENHVSLSKEEFLLREKYGFFVMNWESHGFYYGIGSEITLWMDAGCDVIVNGSRAYLDSARLLFPDLHIILVTASSDRLRERLTKRGRETPEDIEKRISRSHAIPEFKYLNVSVINNDHSLIDSVNNFKQLLLS